MDRRTILRRSAAILVAGVAGCTGDGTTEPDPSPATTPTQSVTPTGSSTPEPTSTSVQTTTDRPMETTGPPTRTSPTPTSTPTPTAAQVVDVGPGGTLRFEPPDFTIASGETVQWVWQSSNHNVKAESTPSNSDWAGTPGGEFDTFQTGHRYSYSFDVPGRYEYYCGPHRSAGMTGAFTVE